MTTLIALIAVYFGALAVLAIIARPYRIRLSRLANELVSDYPEDTMFRVTCDHLLSDARSWRAAPIRFVMFLLAILVPGDVMDRRCEETEKEHPEVMNDPRLRMLFDCYAASIAAVNPLFGILMYAARGAFRFKAFLYHRGKSTRKLTDFVGMQVYS